MELRSQLYTHNNLSVWKAGYSALIGASHIQSNEDLPKTTNIYTKCIKWIKCMRYLDNKYAAQCVKFHDISEQLLAYHLISNKKSVCVTCCALCFIFWQNVWLIGDFRVYKTITNTLHILQPSPVHIWHSPDNKVLNCGLLVYETMQPLYSSKMLISTVYFSIMLYMLRLPVLHISYSTTSTQWMPLLSTV